MCFLLYCDFLYIATQEYDQENDKELFKYYAIKFEY